MPRATRDPTTNPLPALRLRHLGYACTNTALGTKSRTVRLANLTTEKLIPVITQNLESVEAILRWNLERGIRFFRISSGLIPFGSLDAFPFDWREAFGWKFDSIRRLVKAEDLRVSAHPGQYTVLNSPKDEVVENSLAELEHQAEVLRLIDPKQGTMTLHVGGAYGDKPAALDRFAQNLERLSDEARSMLILENDDKTYNLDEVLGLCERTGLPMVFDYFHHRLHHAGERPDKDLVERLERVVATWDRGVPKFHLSSAREEGTTAHADLIEQEDFDHFLSIMREVGDGAPFDLMLEAKKKEQALLALDRPMRHGNKKGRPRPKAEPPAHARPEDLSVLDV